MLQQKYGVARQQRVEDLRNIHSRMVARVCAENQNAAGRGSLIEFGEATF